MGDAARKIRAVDDERGEAESPLEDRHWVLENESLLLGALKDASEAIEKEWTIARVRRIQVPLPGGGTGPLEFRVRKITSDEWERAQRRSLMAKPGSRPGAARDTVDYDLLSRESIVVATHPDDAAKLWNSPAVKRQYGVLKPVDVVMEMLLPGEISNIANGLIGLAGFFDDPMEVAKSAD
jgi:hypothetical protein